MTVRRGSATHPLRVLFQDGALGAWSDDQLLERYLDGEAEASERAFAVLVERHGPMVRHVCAAILNDPEETADAFQATFLVLAKRAGSIRRAESVGPWLFGVARRLASRARVEAAKRRRMEREHAERRGASLAIADHDGDRPEDWTALYEELDRLPSRYRDPIVLCHLEGLSHEQAAARIGCPLGTLRTRLSRGRERLRGRLTRRGLKPIGAGASALVLASTVSPAARAEVPISWITAAGRLAASTRPIAAAAPTVAALATPLLRSFTMLTVLKGLFALGASGVVLGVGLSAIGFGESLEPVEEPKTPSNKPTTQVGGRLVPQEPDEDEEPGVGAVGGAQGGMVRVPNEDKEPEVEPGATTSIQVFICPPATDAATIEFLAPNGQRVAKGDVICRLNEESLERELDELELETSDAQADVDDAEESNAVAEAKLRQYRGGLLRREVHAAENAIDIAEEELKLASLILERAKSQQEQGEIDEIELQRARLEEARAVAKYRDAVENKRVLQKYTGDVRILELEREVTKARAAYFRAESVHRLRRLAERRLRQAIGDTVFHAPFDGVVEYARDIQPGARVPGGRAILRIVPLDEAGNEEERDHEEQPRAEDPR